jgi:hypothetical protein
LFFVQNAWSQNEKPKDIFWKKSERITDSIQKKSILYNYFYEESQEQYFIKNKKMLDTKLTFWNYNKYLSIALSFARIGQEAEAEKMLTNIVTFDQLNHKNAYILIPSDTSSTIKTRKNRGNAHYVCLYLSQIYAHQHNFEKALQYVVLADKKYPLGNFYCGNQIEIYDNTLKNLYAQAYAKNR